MQPSIHQSRPELKIYGEGNITFVYAGPKERPADQVVGNLVGTAVGVAILFIIGTILLIVAWSERNNGNGPVVFLVGCGFMVLAPPGAWWTWDRYRHRDQIIQDALDQLTIELSVENRRLIRRYASRREEAWPREKIEDVVVERHTETHGSAENEATAVYCLLNLILRAGGKVDLYGRAGWGTLQEQDMRWMAGELRRALQVPYDAPPAPMLGAAVERNADGITIRVPHKDPATAWREDFLGPFQWIACNTVLLLFCSAILAIGAFVSDGKDPPWETVVGVLAGIPIAAAIVGIMPLLQSFNKTEEVNAIADRTVIALGARAGALVRRYASNRDELWAGSDIAAVRVERVKDKDQVQLLLKKGEVIHLFGEVRVDDKNKLEREGLIWLALELARSLGLAAAEPVKEPANLSEAIIGFGAADREGPASEAIQARDTTYT